MDQKTSRTDQSPAETTRSGGCCGGPKATQDTDARLQPQSADKAPVAKSGGCCCGTN